MKNEILTNVRKIQRSCGFQTINKPCFFNILRTHLGIKNKVENDAIFNLKNKKENCKLSEL